MGDMSDDLSTVQPLPTPVTDRPVVRIDGDEGHRTQVALAEEVPVAMVYDDISFAVMMASPADLVDFAYGFSLSEGVISSADEILSVTPQATPDGIELQIALADDWPRAKMQPRRLPGRSGCGVCGVEALQQIKPIVRPVGRRLRLTPAAIRRALDDLRAYQPLNRQTGALHAAAHVAPDGAITCVREDVGRHNALDKLIGALARSGGLPPKGFLLLTSRCSYEMVQKAVLAGFEALVAISAPTTLALDLADQAGLTVVGLARADAQIIHAGPERLVLPVTT